MMKWPTTLATAMQRANDIELARHAAHLGTQQQRRTWNPQRQYRGRGRRGRALATYVASAQAHTDIGQSVRARFGARVAHPSANDQCHRCQGYGHWANQCPTPPVRGRRGGRRGRRGRGNRGGRGQGQGRGMAMLVLSEPAATAAAAAGKLAGPHHGQLRQLQGQSDHPGRHEPRVAMENGGNPTRKYKYRSREEALDSRKRRKN